MSTDLLDPVEASAKYPDAWQRIEADVENARHGYHCELLPLVAAVITVNDDEVLEVVAMTDICIVEDGQDSFARMTFTTKLAPF